MSDLLKPLSKFDVPNLNFDPARFNDRVAEQTDWSPAVLGGSSSRTLKLKQISPDRMAFRPAASVIASVVIAFSILSL